VSGQPSDLAESFAGGVILGVVACVCAWLGGVSGLSVEFMCAYIRHCISDVFTKRKREKM
jgi:hypothetical protein